MELVMQVFLIAAAAALMPAAAISDVYGSPRPCRLSNVLGDHMVLQQGKTARVWHRAFERRGSLAHLGLAARLVLPSAMQRKPPISLASSRRGSIERRVAGARGVCLQLVWATSDTFGQAHGSSCCVDRRLQDGPRHGIQRQGVRTAQFGRAQPRQIERAWTCSW